MKPGVFDVQEYRNGGTSNEIFPEHVATLGTVAMALYFIPTMPEISISGARGGQSGQSTSLADPLFAKSRTPFAPSELPAGNSIFSSRHQGPRVDFHGYLPGAPHGKRSGIGSPADTFAYRAPGYLYGPVPFQKKTTRAMAALATERIWDFNGHRIHRRQDLSNYLLFWVDERESIEKPKTTEVPQESSPVKLSGAALPGHFNIS